MSWVYKKQLHLLRGVGSYPGFSSLSKSVSTLVSFAVLYSLLLMPITTFFAFDSFPSLTRVSVLFSTSYLFY
ncbi:hypothetical protein L6452_04824 [Arctium lappa]|uniref:Uncharacterized protein n=1 Tax=Arctium lappa TaxID=4217 RepID=A0ACB9EEL5_ARCLA|nr:hypothetical protein L6452_04824 [Arctium lappa]